MSVELAVVPDTQSKSKQEDNPYEEYMWMGEEEYEFEQDVLAQLEEEEFLDGCLQDMLEEEALGLFIPPDSSASSSSTSSSLPPIQNLNISNANGDEKLENGPHGNGDVILMPASDVRYEAGAGGNARYEQPWLDDSITEKNEDLSDSDSSEGGSPQR